MKLSLGRTLLLLMFFLTGCQSSPQADFARVQPGMEKYDVLDNAGGPTFVRRKNGEDHWIYVLRDRQASGDEAKQVREVDFRDDKAIYVGEPSRPRVSAKEQDRLNMQPYVDAQTKRNLEQLYGPSGGDAGNNSSPNENSTPRPKAGAAH